MPRVELTAHLFQFFPALEGRELRVPGATVAEVLEGLEELAPGIGFYVRDEAGRLRQHVNIYVGDRAVTDRGTLGDPVEDGQRVLILQALSGG